MTFEELQDLLAEQFSCDTGDLSRGTALADLGADHEDMIELAWALGEAIGEEIDESELSEDFTIGELWRFVRLVDGFDKLIEARTGIHTMVAEDAISCVAEGTGKSLDSLNDMQDGTVNLSRRKQMN